MEKTEKKGRFPPERIRGPGKWKRKTTFTPPRGTRRRRGRSSKQPARIPNQQTPGLQNGARPARGAKSRRGERGGRQPRLRRQAERAVRLRARSDGFGFEPGSVFRASAIRRLGRFFVLRGRAAAGGGQSLRRFKRAATHRTRNQQGQPCRKNGARNDHNQRIKRGTRNPQGEILRVRGGAIKPGGKGAFTLGKGTANSRQ